MLRQAHNTAKAIAQYANDAAIDIIVIGSTRRGALDRMLMGSVANR